MSLTAFPERIDISPDNWQDITIEKDFTNPRAGVTVQVDGFALTREGHERLLKWLYTDIGRFESPEAYFKTETGRVYDMFLNLKSLEVYQHRSVCSVDMRKSFKHFFDDADSLTFSLMYKKGFLTDDLFIDFPYVEIPDNLPQMKAINIVVLGGLIFQLQVTVKSALDIGAELAGVFTAIAGALKIVILVTFIATLIVSIVQTLIELKELFYPTMRNYLAVSDYNLIKKGCEALGYTLQSNFLSVDMAKMYTIPKPSSNNIDVSITDQIQNYFAGINHKHNQGYPTQDDTTPTLGSLIDFYLQQFDLGIVIKDGVVTIEKDSFFAYSALLEIDPTMSEQSDKEDKYVFNDDEVWGRKFFKWSDDWDDIHSIETNKPTRKLEAITTPNTIINNDLVSLTGLDEYTAPFALVKRKNKLSAIEEYIQFMGNVINTQFSAVFNQVNQVLESNFNKTLDLSITDREGIGVFERSYWGVTRKVWADKVTIYGKEQLRQPVDYLRYMDQNNIDNDYNQGLRVKENNFAIKEIEIPFSDYEFEQLLSNRYVNYKGYDQKIKVLSVKFKPYKYKATLMVALPDESAFNTKTTLL